MPLPNDQFSFFTSTSMAFEQSLEAWDEVYTQADQAAEDRASSLVRQYLRNSSAKNRCPLLAFAPGVVTGGVDQTGAQAYEAGAKSLLDKFMEESVDQVSDLAQPTEAENEALVIFAAMIGTRLLAQSVGQSTWIRAMETAVNVAARKQNVRG